MSAVDVPRAPVPAAITIHVAIIVVVAERIVVSWLLCYCCGQSKFNESHRTFGSGVSL